MREKIFNPDWAFTHAPLVTRLNVTILSIAYYVTRQTVMTIKLS